MESRAEDEGARAQDEEEKEEDEKEEEEERTPRYNRSNEENAFSHTRLIGVAKAVDRGLLFSSFLKNSIHNSTNVERRCYPPCPCLPTHAPPQFYPFAPIAPRSQ